MPRLARRLATVDLHVVGPTGFDFLSTVYSHGWYSLPPFSIRNHNELGRILRLPDGTIVQCSISGAGQRLRVACQSKRVLTRSDYRWIRSAITVMFRLDEDLTAFHRTALSSPKHRWIVRLGAGRLLRAPTVFEDMVKTICTTNCTWSLTTLIVRNLVNSLGYGMQDEVRSFPDAGSLAGSSERFLRNEIKAGYRSPYLLELANRVVSGKLHPEEWRSGERPTGEVLRELLSVKGIGPYAAQNMLRLLGHYEFLALDSWVRSKYYSLYHEGRPVKDRTIERSYVRYGRWKGLIFWMEMTKDWHDEKFARGPRQSEQ